MHVTWIASRSELAGPMSTVITVLTLLSDQSIWMLLAGFTKEGITFPSRHAQLALEKQVCQEANINPKDICYVEAHGTGTVAGDGQELDAINKWYGQAPGRTEPVLIGSVKSNMGHCEGASCLASTFSVFMSICISDQTGMCHDLSEQS